VAPSLATRTEEAPPYAPELSPDGGIRDFVKNDKLANYCPNRVADLNVAVETQSTCSHGARNA
jgi:hypothetical protein